MELRMRLYVTPLLLALMWSNFGLSNVVTGEKLENRTLQGKVKDFSNKQMLPELIPPPDSTECASESDIDLDDLRDRFLPCLPAVLIFGSSDPGGECCIMLQSSNIKCLCTLFIQGRSKIPPGIVNIDSVADLPRRCGIPIPEGSTCAGISVPSRTRAAASKLDGNESEPVRFGWFTFNP